MTETINKRTWQEVEQDIEVAQAMQDEITSKDEGDVLLGQLNELYEESNEAFQPVRDRLTGEVEQLRVQKLGEISAHEAMKAARQQVAEDAARTINESTQTAYNNNQR